jgi:hypothetical protein
MNAMYQTTLQAHEGSKLVGRLFTKSYALAINVAIDAEHPLEEEIRHINECFLDWLRNRGKQCGELAFIFEAPAGLHEQIRDHIGKLLNQPLDMDEVISRLDITLVLINPETGEDTELGIKWEPPAR